jgi:hypothetical protein
VSDPTPTTKVPYTFWASGLYTYAGKPKQPVYDAWRLPLYLPVSTTKPGRKLEVWGCARPASYAIADTGQSQPVQIQFAQSGSSSYSTLATATITSKSNCYFRLFLNFPSSGTVRLRWQYPAGDPLLGDFPSPPGSSSSSSSSSYGDPLNGSDSTPSATVYSRSVKVTVR